MLRAIISVAFVRLIVANERTFLAWLRTSLSIITVGVGVAQLFKLAPVHKNSLNKDYEQKEYGKPIGTALILLGILFLFFGTIRYFTSQRWLTKGKYPASRGLVIVSSCSILALMIALTVAVLSQP